MTLYVSTALGVSLLLFVAYDVYATILDARARAGPISETMNRAVWRVSRWCAFRLSRARRHRVLNFVGPLLLPTLIIIYLALQIVGFGLIYFPHMPAHFNVAEGDQISTWFDSLYFSGVTFTTAGYGDITPRTTSMRIVAVIEASAGLALISLSITYLITVYRALERKRAVALSFYHQAEEGADVGGFIVHHHVDGQFYGLVDALRTATRDIQELLESHVEHPIIHYFHTIEVYKSLPRVLFLTLESSAVIQSCLDAGVYPQTCRHPTVLTLGASARHVLNELVASLGIEPRNQTSADEEFEESRRWEKRYRATLRRLRDDGVATNPDTRAGWEIYRAQRDEWEASLHRFANHLGYDWDEVTGDRDLEYAADEELEKPSTNGEE